MFLESEFFPRKTKVLAALEEMLHEDSEDEDYKTSARRKGTRKQTLASMGRHYVQDNDVDSIWKAISQLTGDVRKFTTSHSTFGLAQLVVRSRNAKCWACGKPGHMKRDCPEASRKGTWSGADWLAVGATVEKIKTPSSSQILASYKDKQMQLFSLDCEGTHEQCLLREGAWASGRVNRFPVDFMLDTEAAVTMVSKEAFDQALPDATLQKSNMQLVPAGGDPLKAIRRTEMQLELGSLQVGLPVMVINNFRFQCLLGSDFIHDEVGPKYSV